MRCIIVTILVSAIWCRNSVTHSNPIESKRSLIQNTQQSSQISSTAPILHTIKIRAGLDQIPAGSEETTRLTCSYNQIVTLPAFCFTNATYHSLKHIDLSHNRLNSIHVLAFRGLRALNSVDLSVNKLDSLDPYTFRQNQHLKRLNLANNRLKFERLQVFLISSSLETLILNGNHLEQIFELTFVGLPNLKYLMLDRNPALVTIASNSFRPFVGLDLISLKDTGVVRLTVGMFGSEMTLPKVIDVQNTPLAQRFEPPLSKLTNDSVKNLLKIDEIINL